MSFVEKEFKNDDEINFKEILFVLWGSKILIAICIFVLQLAQFIIHYLYLINLLPLVF